MLGMQLDGFPRAVDVLPKTEGSEREKGPGNQDRKTTLQWEAGSVCVVANMSVRGLIRTLHICWKGKYLTSSKIDGRRSADEDTAGKRPVQR